MSRLIKIKASRNFVPRLRAKDNKHDSEMEIWAYHDCVMFEISGEIISLSHKQFDKVCAFVKREKKK